VPDIHVQGGLALQDRSRSEDQRHALQRRSLAQLRAGGIRCELTASGPRDEGWEGESGRAVRRRQIEDRRSDCQGSTACRSAPRCRLHVALRHEAPRRRLQRRRRLVAARRDEVPASGDAERGNPASRFARASPAGLRHHALQSHDGHAQGEGRSERAPQRASALSRLCGRARRPVVAPGDGVSTLTAELADTALGDTTRVTESRNAAASRHLLHR